MATFFVSSSGSNTAPYDTWAKAATLLATALAAASTPGDVVVIQYNGVPAADSAVSATTTWSFAADRVSLISASNDGGSAYTPTPMGTANWVGNGSGASRAVTINPAVNGNNYVYGVTLRNAGSGSAGLSLCTSDDRGIIFEQGLIWLGAASASGRINIGAAASGICTYVKLINTTLRVENAGHLINISSKIEIHGGSISTLGAAPTILFACSGGGTTFLDWIGGDLSGAASSALVSGSSISAAGVLKFYRCKLHASSTLASTFSSGVPLIEVWLFDCSDIAVPGLLAVSNSLGEFSVNSSINFSGGLAGVAWELTSSSLASPQAPICSPWIDIYYTGSSAITPFLEIARSDSATALKNDEVWAEISAKTTSGSPMSTVYSDRAAPATAGVNQAAGAGTGSWSGATMLWSGKVDTGAAITPAAVGHIRARVCLAKPNTTVYVDPQIRGI